MPKKARPDPKQIVDAGSIVARLLNSGIQVAVGKHSGSANQEEAKRIATDLAAMLGSKPVSNDKMILNPAVEEPLVYPFVISTDTKEFRAKVRVSDTTYAFDLKYRRGEISEDAVFCVSFKTPDRVMFTKDRVVAVSKALGVEVYRQGFVEDRTVVKYLLDGSVREHLGKIDFRPLARLFLSPVRLEVTSKLKSAKETAEQLQRFMALMGSLACARTADSVRRTKR